MLLNLSYYLFLLLLSFLIYLLFYFSSFKNFINNDDLSPFECGYMSFSQSIFSFSIHYLLYVFLFLLLDLEFSLTFWYFYSSGFIGFMTSFFVSIFLLIVLISLIYEWYSKKLDWSY